MVQDDRNPTAFGMIASKAKVVLLTSLDVSADVFLSPCQDQIVKFVACAM